MITSATCTDILLDLNGTPYIIGYINHDKELPFRIDLTDNEYNVKFNENMVNYK